MKQNIKRYWNLRAQGKSSAERPGIMKYIRLAILLCFVLGIIGANIIDKSKMSGFGLWNSYFIEKFKYARIRPGELFYYIMKERLPIILFLLLFTITNWGTLTVGVFLAWQGFAAGFLMAASVVSYGAKGILLMGTAFFPQYLFYIPAYVVCIYLAAFFKERIQTKGGGSGIGHKREYFLFVALCLLLLGIYITGILLESYVNPFLLKKILKIF